MSVLESPEHVPPSTIGGTSTFPIPTHTTYKRPAEQIPEELCLHEVFEAAADKSPTGVAVIYKEVTITYRDLDKRANQMARYLRSQGVGNGSLVGIFLERSELPIVALLAVLKAGAAYVPLDPVYPPDRISHILDTAGIQVLLTETSLVDRINGFQGTIVKCDGISRMLCEFASERLSRDETGVSARDLCYIIFTSGTTGRPKGIMTEHRNVTGFCKGFNRVIKLNSRDRVYQGFSLGFDGSVEEIWMAFTNNATLCVGTSEASRLGDEAHALLNAYRATVFSTVPTFLGLIRDEVPSLRLLIVSGEPCPPHLIDRWAIANRRMLNVYGPTETTVNTTVAHCKPGRPVTIGKPLDGYEIRILNEKLEPVLPGTPGELYVGGVGVSRGYFKQPDLTSKTYIVQNNDPDNVLYRTGDLVSMTTEGELLFLGRIDSQVKVRGFRIELGEIESIVREVPSIDQAVITVCKCNDLDELVIHAVAKTPSVGIDRNEVCTILSQRLPPYMVPSYLEELESLPLLPSGKVDRKNLPPPITRLLKTTDDVVLPENPTEAAMVAVMKKVFSLDKVSTTADFFCDLGAYSLLIVGMIATLRRDYDLDVTVRDAYKYTTIQSLSKHIAGTRSVTSAAFLSNAKSSKAAFHSVSRIERWTCYSLQALSILLFFAYATTPVVGLLWAAIKAGNGAFPVSWIVWIGVAVSFLAYPLNLMLSIALKWIVIGRFRPGRYPLWSLTYFRFWLALRAQALSGIGLAAATPIMSLYYRLMGARVGQRCIIDTSLCTAFDLVSIGDDCSIGSETQLAGYRIENGELIIGSVTLGNRCFVGTHCALGLNVEMADDSSLDDLSLLPDETRINAGESWRGSPAQAANFALPQVPELGTTKTQPFLFGCIHFIALQLVGLITLVTAVLPMAIVAAAYLWGGWTGLIAAIFVTAFLGVFYFCFVIAGTKYLILPRLKPGTYNVETLFYVRKWIVDLLLATSRTVLHAVYTTIYFPLWLRLLGAKVGRGAEISTVSQLYPDLTTIGDESFFADGSMIGGRRFYKGHMSVDNVTIGRRSFIGNNARLPIGGALGENSLLGCLSTLPDGQQCPPDGTEWLGSPSFQLPYRKKDCEFSVTEIFKPTKRLIAARCIIDALRIFTPTYIFLVSSLCFFGAIAYGLINYGAITTLLMSPLVALALSITVAMSAVVLKWVLMGRYVPVRKPLWSVYVWLNELINGVYETVAVPSMAGFMGTPFYNWYLRLLGCKIGKHSYIGTALFSEFDLVRIGDYVSLNAGVVVQNHLFEDRIMKSSYLDIGDECSVGNMSVVLYDSKIEPGTVISPLSLVMKGDTVPPRSHWTGIPISQN